MTINIIFDADDTLWYTEFLYDEARARFAKLLSERGLGDPTEISELSRTIDDDNFSAYRFSRRRFPTSLHETYENLCFELEIASDPELVKEIKKIGESVFENPIKPVENVEQTLRIIKEKGANLILWTQGDNDIQKQRIQESGLEKFFDKNQIIITDAKSSERLKSLLDDLKLNSDETWIVGNSIKSDINPALGLRLKCVWIPANVWSREKDEIKFPPSGEYLYQADHLEEIQEIIFMDDKTGEIEKLTDDPNGIVYLFVSAYQDLYRQYVMDILAYPRGYVFWFPYDSKRWLPRVFRESDERLDYFAKKLRGRNALVVFVDERVEGEPRRIQRFLPIRQAKIRNEVEIKGGVLHIEFELGNYAVYDEQAIHKYDQFIKSIPARPRANSDDCSYVSIGPNFEASIRTQKIPNKDDNAWQTIVEQLGRLNASPKKVKPNPFIPTSVDPFEKAMFFRVTSLEELPSKKQIDLKTFFDKESGYEIRDSKNYRLNLLFYFPNRPHSLVRRSKVIASLSSEFINPVGRNEIPLSFRYDQRHIDFITDRVFSDIWTSISIYTETPKDSTTPTENKIVTPEPTFLLKIKTARWINIATPVVFAVSTIISSLNAQFAALIVALLPNAEAFQQEIGAGLAIVGSTIATLLLFSLYRKLK